MTRIKYEQELEELNLDLIRMGAMAEQAIEQAMRALDACDIVLARKVLESDDKIDDMAQRIESQSMKLIMKQQPVAGDLRAISAAFKMAADLERIGDQAADIAEIAVTLCRKQDSKKPEHLKKMEKQAVEMVHMAVDAYVKMSASVAEQVIRMDNVQDALFNQVKGELMDIAYEDREAIDYVVDFLLIIKYLERISDHAENIADWTFFAIEGTHKNERIL
jgi:phosphate transport system protein